MTATITVIKVESRYSKMTYMLYDDTATNCRLSLNLENGMRFEKKINYKIVENL